MVARFYARVSAPDPLSNVRLLRYEPASRTLVNKTHQNLVYRYHNFWAYHNQDFHAGKRLALQQGKDLEEFYRGFLERTQDEQRAFARMSFAGNMRMVRLDVVEKLKRLFRWVARR